MIKNKIGFTLIELLAVVLIIGILTSVAVPKYRRTIERAAVTEALINLRSIHESAKRYKAATSEVPLQLKGLDISFFEVSAADEENDSFTMGNYTYTLASDSIKTCHENYCIYVYYDSPTYGGKDVIVCKIQPGGKYDWICDALGGEETHDGSNEYIIKD